MKLDTFNNPDFNRGAPWWLEALWIAVSGLLFSTWLPGSRWRCALLRMFGAKVGRGVVIKPAVRIKFPWKLTVGNYSWLGESVWIDNLDRVEIGDNCCISQGVYFCTGNHRWDKATFDLVTKPIIIEDESWIGARATLLPGVVVHSNCVLSAGFIAAGHYEKDTIYKQDLMNVKRTTRVYS